MHRLLQRQLKRYFGPEEFHPPWCEFLQAIDEFYCSADAFREVLERSLVLSTQELHQANAEMRAIFQAIPDLVFRIQLDGTILEIKAGTENDLWGKPRELLGKKMQNVPDVRAATALQKLLERSGGSGVMDSAEYSLTIHGEPRHYEARLVPMLAGEAVAIVQNITARKRREALLEERRLELQCANQQLQKEIERRHAMEEQLRYEASHDRLTGLANRSLIMQRI
jgi:PAS domain-containing protein